MRHLVPAIAMAALLLMAGCTSGPGQSAAPSTEASTELTTTTTEATTESLTTNVSTTEGECGERWTYHRVTSVPHPEIPDTLTNESAATFAKAYEQASIYQGLAGQRTNISGGNGININVPKVNRTDDGWIVYLNGGYSTYGCHEGSPYVGDAWISTYYYINESAVYRQTGEYDADVDPRVNGTRVV